MYLSLCLCVRIVCAYSHSHALSHSVPRTASQFQGGKTIQLLKREQDDITRGAEWKERDQHDITTGAEWKERECSLSLCFLSFHQHDITTRDQDDVTRGAQCKLTVMRRRTNETASCHTNECISPKSIREETSILVKRDLEYMERDVLNTFVQAWCHTHERNSSECTWKARLVDVWEETDCTQDIHV